MPPTVQRLVATFFGDVIGSVKISFKWILLFFARLELGAIERRLKARLPSIVIVLSALVVVK